MFFKEVLGGFLLANKKVNLFVKCSLMLTCLTLSIQQRSICVIRMLTTGNGNVLVKGKVLCGQREQQEGHMTITQLWEVYRQLPSKHPDPDYQLADHLF